MPNNLNKIQGLPMPAVAAIIGDVSASQTALGSSQGTGFALAANFTVFTTVAASTAATLPVPTSVASAGVAVGDSYRVANLGASTLTVYPGLGGNIGTAAANAGFSVAANKTAEFTLVTSTQWIAILSA